MSTTRGLAPRDFFGRTIALGNPAKAIYDGIITALAGRVIKPASPAVPVDTTKSTAMVSLSRVAFLPKYVNLECLPG